MPTKALAASVAVADDAGEEAVAANAVESAVPTAEAVPTSGDDEGFVWPEGSEAAPNGVGERSESADGEPAVNATPDAPLPPLDDLVKRIPAEARETLEDLFRARFTAVRRVAPASLKNAKATK